MADLSTGDLALMRDSNGWDNGMGGMIWLFAILAMMGGGFGGWGANRGPMMPPDVATAGQLQAGLDNQQTQSALQQLLVGTANNNYETARLVNEQTNALMQQNNTNLINAIQGFNQVNLGIQNQTNVLSTQLQALQAQMNECCCSIKTQMLQDRLDAAERHNVALQGVIDNANQSQYLLGQMGKWVANAPAAAA